MSKPAAGSAPLRWGTVPLIPADLTEPDTTHKDEGWQDAEEPPHSYFNYWMNLAYLWFVYLDNITAEALTWTALETFNAGIVAANPNGAALAGTSTIAVGGTDFFLSDVVAAVKGVLTAVTNGDIGAGILGKGPVNNSGSVGVAGLGGNSSSGAQGGGFGGFFVGGSRLSSGVVAAGVGVRIYGGAVDGTVNTNAAGGYGLIVDGGIINSDANGRRGGVALRVSGGQGQAGYGHAIDVLTGDVNLQNNTNLIINAGGSATMPTLTVTGNETVGGTLGVTGLTSLGQLAANGNCTIQNGHIFLNPIGGGPVEVSAGMQIYGAASTLTGGLTVDTLASTGTISPNAVAATGNVQGATLTATGSGSSIPLPALTAASLINSWQVALGSTVQYWKDAFGMVHLQGQMGTGTTGTVAFNLPAGFRPTSVSKLLQVVDAVSVSMRITIDTSGNVTPLGGYTTYVTLDGVSFRP